MPLGQVIAWAPEAGRGSDQAGSPQPRIIVDGKHRLLILLACLYGQTLLLEHCGNSVPMRAAFNPQQERFLLSGTKTSTTRAWLPDIAVLFDGATDVNLLIDQYCDANPHCARAQIGAAIARLRCCVHNPIALTDLNSTYEKTEVLEVFRDANKTFSRRSRATCKAVIEERLKSRTMLDFDRPMIQTINASQRLVAERAAVAQEIGRPALQVELLTQFGKSYPIVAANPPETMEAGMCFKNAAMLALQSQGTDNPLYYCEGYAVADKFPMPWAHAWCVDDAGEIHDPTWPNGSDYFGIPFTHNGLANLLLEIGYYGILDHLYVLQHKRWTLEQIRTLITGAIAGSMSQMLSGQSSSHE